MSGISEQLPVTPEVQSILDKMNGFQLAYKLSLFLNSLYSCGGYSLGRSVRSYLLDLFMNLNRRCDVQILPVFNFVEPVKTRASALVKAGPSDRSFVGRVCIRNRKILSAVLLHKLKEEYLRGMSEADAGDITDVDHSFSSLYPLFSLLYDAYLLELGLPIERVVRFAQTYEHEKLRQLTMWYSKQLRG
jgi:hypothetical protein